MLDRCCPDEGGASLGSNERFLQALAFRVCGLYSGV